MSPVLASVLLIAITLVSAVAVAGFYFNLLGTYSSGSALSNSLSLGGGTTTTSTTGVATDEPVTVTPVSCTSSGKTKSKCTLSVLDGGASKISVVKDGCFIEVSGTLVAGTNGAKTINSGKSATVTCTVNRAEPPKGTSAAGYVTVSGLPAAPFSGTWG